MRLLIDELTGRAPGSAVAPGELPALYAVAAQRWLRVNFVSSLDGAAAGDDGRSGSLNSPADKQVFDTLRRLDDAVLVGAGTARDEGYRAFDKPLVLVSRRGEVPDRLRDAAPGSVLMATCASGVGAARAALGADAVLLAGDDEVDLASVVDQLAARGLRRILSEGGPSLFGSLLAAGVVDELCLTLAPVAVAGGGPRISHGEGVEVPMTPTLLLEADGNLIGRWSALRR